MYLRNITPKRVMLKLCFCHIMPIFTYILKNYLPQILVISKYKRGDLNEAPIKNRYLTWMLNSEK